VPKRSEAGYVDAGDWIALAALGVSVLSAAGTVLERKLRQRADLEEAQRRERELSLLGERIAIERERGTADVRASARQIAEGANGGSMDIHYFRVTNAGPGTARRLSFSCVGSQGPVTRTYVDLPLLLPGESQEIPVRIPYEVSRAGGLRLKVRWLDVAGSHEELLADFRTP
jgi:hypothetical protein